ncbi:hypothetical protein AB1K99_05540 [Lederbergia ruris]
MKTSIQPRFGYAKTKESRENVDPTKVWICENKGKARKRRSTHGLDMRKQRKAEKPSIQSRFGYAKTKEIRENVDPTKVWICENKGEPRKRRSNRGLDVRKQRKSEKTSIQPWFGYAKAKEIRENVDPTMVWMYENKGNPRKRRSNHGLDVRKQRRAVKTSIQPWFGCTKTKESRENVDPIKVWICENKGKARKR